MSLWIGFSMKLSKCCFEFCDLASNLKQHHRIRSNIKHTEAYSQIQASSESGGPEVVVLSACRGSSRAPRAASSAPRGSSTRCGARRLMIHTGALLFFISLTSHSVHWRFPIFTVFRWFPLMFAIFRRCSQMFDESE